jgi:hypothetical protein
LTIKHSPEVEITANPDVEFVPGTMLVVNMDPLGRSAVLCSALAYKDQTGLIRMKLVWMSHPYRFHLCCHCLRDGDVLSLHLSKDTPDDD